MAEEKDKRIEDTIQRMVQDAYESHHLVYLNTAERSPEVLHFEGVDDFTIGNITFYFPRGAQLGNLMHGVFKPYMQDRTKGILDIQKNATDLIEAQDEEQAALARQREIADRHRRMAQKEIETAKKEAPRTDSKGASERKDA